MKPIIILFALLVGYHLQAQMFNYTNITGSNPKSNKLYTGINNQLILHAAIPATSAASNNGTAKLAGDTLELTPASTGPTQVTVQSANGEEILYFDAKELPEVELILENHPPHAIMVSRFKRGQKFIIQPNPHDDFWSGYTIDNFFASIGMASLQNTGAMPNTPLLEAVRKSPKGSVLHISVLNVANEKTGIHRTVKSSWKYTVN